MPESAPNPAAQLASALQALAETLAGDGSVQIDVRVTVTSHRAHLDRARAEGRPRPTTVWGRGRPWPRSPKERRSRCR